MREVIDFIRIGSRGLILNRSIILIYTERDMKILIKQFCRLIFITLFLSSSSFAQDQKIGVVNFQVLMESSPQFRQVMEALASEFQPRQREALAKQKEFEELSAKIQKDAAVMGATERSNAEKEFRELQREVNRLGTELQEDVNLRRNEEIGKLQRTLLEIVNAFAQSNDFDIVLADGVIYASQSVNITPQILDSLEDNFQNSESN